MADKKQKLASSHYIGGAVGLIIILVIAGYLMYAKQVSSPVVGNRSDTSTPNGVGDSSLVVENQAAGESVSIKFMDLPEGGWVAIKEKSSGRILGAARFPAGATSGSVELLRATVAGGAYEALVYADDGDKAFDHKKDTVVDGMSASFSAQ